MECDPPTERFCFVLLLRHNSGSMDEEIFIWNVVSQTRIQMLIGHRAGVQCLALLDNGLLLRCATVRLPRRCCLIHVRVPGVSLTSFLSACACSGSQDTHLRVWDCTPENYRCVGVFEVRFAKCGPQSRATFSFPSRHRP